MKKMCTGLLLASSAGLAISATAQGQIVNGNFETGNLTGWTTTASLPPPVIDNVTFHAGAFSALLGSNTGPEPLGDGAMYQSYAVPAGGASLSFWYKTFTTDSITFDWQDAYIQDNTGTTLATIFHVCQTADWTQQVVDLTPYAGTTIRVAFLVHQDGFGDDTSMNIDDVSVSLAGATGACCLPTGACTPNLTSAACATAGGVYQGDNSVCGTCPQPGACCIPSGCVFVLQPACVSQGGTYMGANVTCAAANCPQPCPPITGQLVTGTPNWPVVHTTIPGARLFRDGVPDTCAAPGTAAGSGAGPYNCDVYSFVNNTATPVCVTFTLTQADPNSQCNLYGGAYIPTFSAANVVTNNVASTGNSTGIPPANISMSFTVPANSPFQIVINDANAVAVSTCASQYTFQLSGGNLNCSPVVNTCYPNCDHSTTLPCLNVLDFSCFLNEFAAGHTYANCDASTVIPVLNVLDFSCFLNKFAAGCSNC